MHQDVAMTQDVLVAGPPRAHSRSVPIWPIAIVVVIVVSLISTAAVVAFGVRTAQAERLITAVEGSENAMKQAQLALNVVLEGFEAPDLSADDRADLVEDLTATAAEGAESIEQAGVRVVDVRVAPWDTRVTEAKTVYLEHNLAWVTYLTAVSQDPSELARPQPAINATFVDARLPLWQAVPAIDFLDLRQRVNEIYADFGSGDNGGGTLT